MRQERNHKQARVTPNDRSDHRLHDLLGATMKLDAREIANSLGGDVSGDSAHKPALGPLGDSLDDFVA
jgi:hypothetical protein